jgi:hypothetical protein
MSGGNKRVILGVGVILLSCLLVHQFLLSRIWEDIKGLREKLKEQTRELKRLIDAGVPNDLKIQRANSDLQALRDRLTEVIQRMRVELGPAYFLSGVQTPAVQFKETLIRVQRSLQREALLTPEGVKLPERLEFPEDIAHEDASEYLKRLGIAEMVIRVAIEAELEAVTYLRALARDTQGYMKGRFLNLILIEIGCRGPLQNLLKFLHRLQSKGSFFVVEELSLSKMDLSSRSLDLDLRLGVAIIDQDGSISPGNVSDSELDFDELFR